MTPLIRKHGALLIDDQVIAMIMEWLNNECSVIGSMLPYYTIQVGFDSCWGEKSGFYIISLPSHENGQPMSGISI